jgi:hypothetical protein
MCTQQVTTEHMGLKKFNDNAGDKSYPILFFIGKKQIQIIDESDRHVHGSWARVSILRKFLWSTCSDFSKILNFFCGIGLKCTIHPRDRIG